MDSIVEASLAALAIHVTPPSPRAPVFRPICRQVPPKQVPTAPKRKRTNERPRPRYDEPHHCSNISKVRSHSSGEAPARGLFRGGRGRATREAGRRRQSRDRNAPQCANKQTKAAAVELKEASRGMAEIPPKISMERYRLMDLASLTLTARDSARAIVEASERDSRVLHRRRRRRRALTKVGTKIKLRCPSSPPRQRPVASPAAAASGPQSSLSKRVMDFVGPPRSL